MKRARRLAWAAAVFCAMALLIAAAPSGQDAEERPQRVPVLAELFTSEGCSSCPPADALLRRLIDEQPVDGVEVIALSEHVTYWDRLGWKDVFSSPMFTARQIAYARLLSTEEVYTPQLVLDGRMELVGSDWKAIRRALGEAARTPRAAVTVTVERGAGDSSVGVTVAVSDVPGGTSENVDVIVAIVEDELVTEVLRGENARRRLRHAAVVRVMETVGRLPQGATVGQFVQDFEIADQWKPEHLRAVAFLQDTETKQVLGSGATD